MDLAQLRCPRCWITCGDREHRQCQCGEHACGATAVNHLRRLGHTRIAVTAGESGFSSTVERVDGVRVSMGDAGPPEHLVMQREHSRAWGAEAMCKLDDRLTAVFATSSELTLGAIPEAQHLDLSIPDDMSLVAIGNTHWFKVCHPPVTAYRQPLHDVGMIAARLLLGRISGERTENGPARIRVEGSLVARETTAALR